MSHEPFICRHCVCWLLRIRIDPNGRDVDFAMMLGVPMIAAECYLAMRVNTDLN